MEKFINYLTENKIKYCYNVTYIEVESLSEEMILKSAECGILRIEPTSYNLMKLYFK